MYGNEDVTNPPRAIVVDANVVGNTFYVPIVRKFDIRKAVAEFPLSPPSFEKCVYRRSWVFDRVFVLAAIVRS